MPRGNPAEVRLIREALIVARLLEKRGQYYYEEIEQKRWILGPGGRSGNCEYCVEAEDRGWIDMDDLYEGPMDDVDEPPLHPHCECGIEQKTRRKRVYV